MVIAIIPARYASTRFPGKPLAIIQGKPMIQRVVEQTAAAKLVDQIIVATDDERIADCVRGFGGTVVMTNPNHPSGTDRCAEVANQYPSAKWILNIQGDEPFIQPEQIDLLVQTLIVNDSIDIATLAKKIDDPEKLWNQNIVKVVMTPAGKALYFSRHPIPFLRGVPTEQWIEKSVYYKHIGLYGFKATALMAIATLRPSLLEEAESLEQLRWLENGFSISVGITELETIGIDTPEDLAKIL